MISKNQELEGVVISIGSNGEGVVKADGVTVFVPFAITGEKIKYKVLKVTSKCAYGKLLEVLSPSRERVKPRCPVFGKCGGCDLQHVNYDFQLEIKRENVKNCFHKIAGIETEVSETVRCENPWGYRNKLQLPVAQYGEETAIGFYAENSHRVVAIDDCPINPCWTKNVIATLKAFMSKYRLKGYNESDRSGDIREITVKEIGEKLIITLVTPKNKINGIESLPEMLSESLDKEFTLFVNKNDKETNVIYGDTFTKICGNDFYYGESDGIKYKGGVLSFLQVNGEMCAKLYSEVKNSIDSDENTTVIDAYSGAGLMTAMLTKNAKNGVGIEIIKEAVDCADELAELNGLSDKMKNYCGKCEELLPEIIKKAKTDKLRLVLDPPRKGCEQPVIDAIRKSGIERIVYVSCMPSTLARDVGLLCGTLKREENGAIIKSVPTESDYVVESVKPFDMFPATRHVETLVVLSHKKPDSHLEVKIDFDNTSLDKTAIAERAEKRKPQEKTTYKKIQEWIEENYGFKVHTAYIAEVKRELGLPMYDAPNAVEELKRTRSHPTEEMTVAIKAALKYFKII